MDANQIYLSLSQIIENANLLMAELIQGKIM